MNASTFSDLIHAQGYAVVPEVLSPDTVGRLRTALQRAIAEESEDHRSHGRATQADPSMVLLCALYGPEFLDLFEISSLMQPFEWILGEGCIVYAYTSSSMPPRASNQSNRIHVDCPRLIGGYITNMGATILLDDFTSDNGATWFLPGSHMRSMPPPADEFYGHGQRVLAEAGSVFYFNARLWHAGGSNSTDMWRHALTINMCRPYMKQRIDIPRALEARGILPMSPAALQKLGFLSQAPASYAEYYLPPEQRKFRQKAE